jgi:5-methylcytosine-specific restriction endonuclease McrA
MRRKRPFPIPERRSIPARVRAEVILRQSGRCADCRTKLSPGEIVLDHRPPIALREPGDDQNDPDRLAAICLACDRRKTSRDLREIAKAKRIAAAHQEHLARKSEKIPGRRLPSRREWEELKRSVVHQLGSDNLDLD